MKRADVIVIGAGAAGLMAACKLSHADKSVIVLEANNRIGGRIHTIKDEKFSMPIELGAEFVHGDLPVTLELLHEAGLSYSDVGFEIWQYQNGQFRQNEEVVDGWKDFLEKVNRLKRDMPLHDYLQQNFGGDEYTALRQQIENYVSGYDTANVRDAGTFALRNEWNHEDEDAQHRIDAGYSALMDYLANICRNAGNEILVNNVVTKIVWEAGNVQVTTSDNNVFKADKAIIALPLGILQADPESDRAVAFDPSLPRQMAALNDIGFGSVIKILLEFDEPFWTGKEFARHAGADLSEMGFLFTEEEIPTFWTQSPSHAPLLTGWLGGPPAYEKKDLDEDAILELSLKSLENTFGIDLKSKLVAGRVANWTRAKYTRGSYAYDKVESKDARQVLEIPVENTLYFAGEYMYEGPAIGTVEAALTSGKKTAARILSNDKP